MTSPVRPADAREPRPGAAPERQAAWDAASHVLAIRLDNLGDVLMTTPALAALARPPGRRVTLLASKSGAAVAGHVPAVAEVIAYQAPWVAGGSGDGSADLSFMAGLAARQFDAAVIFTVCTQSALPAALACRLAGIPLRLAYSRENPYGLLTDWARDTETCGPGMRHEVTRQLDLVARVGAVPEHVGLDFHPTTAERWSMRARLAAAGADPNRPWIVVHPGSSAPSRRYPPERFGIAAARIAASTGAQIVLAAGPDERDAVDAARRSIGAPSVSLAGQLDIGELAALIAEARLLICNNSGPAHLAAATGTPVVVLYALTNPQHTPWRVASRVLSHDVPCRNCLRSVCPEGHHACLLGVDPDAVVRAAMELWTETARRPARGVAP